MFCVHTKLIHLIDNQFKKPFVTPKQVQPKFIQRKGLSPANYDVYYDGFPIENPPVCVKDVPWDAYMKNPQVFDDYLFGYALFGIAKYAPSKKNPEHNKGHIVIQFRKADDALNFLQKIKCSICYSSVLTPCFFGDQKPQDKADYGYPGRVPVMGGLDRSDKDSTSNERPTTNLFFRLSNDLPLLQTSGTCGSM